MRKIIHILLISLCGLISTLSLVHASIAIDVSEINRIDQEPFSHEAWNQGSFIISKSDGSDLSIELLRPKWWFKEHQVIVGGDIHLSLPEMGVDGLARVLSVNTIPQSLAKVPDGHEVVTGKFTHVNASVIDLYFDSEKALGVTINHPFWSINKSSWIDAGDLQVGENVKTIKGVTKLVRRAEREGLHTVYNLEVHRRHTFYVSDIGVLVHNVCSMKGISKKIWHPTKNGYIDLTAKMPRGFKLVRTIGNPHGKGAIWKLKDGKRVWAITSDGKVLRVRFGR